MKSAYCLAAVALAVITATAQAETCNKPLKVFTRIPLTAADGIPHLQMQVEIDGKPVKLALDTGAHASIISQKTASALGLKLIDAPVKSYDVTGHYSNHMVEASFKFGQIRFEKVQFMVSETMDQMDGDGVIGANLLSMFDVSIDPAGRQIDLLSQDHCPDNVIYWPATVFARIPFNRSPDNQIIVNVMLDGKPLKAVLDTGAENSTLFLKTAQRQFGLTPGAPDTPSAGTVNGKLAAYQHTFKSLTFNDVAVGNPTITLIPDQMTEHFTQVPTGSRIALTDEVMRWDMLLGMNVLRHLHLYIAYKDRVLYLTAAQPSGTAVAQPSGAKAQ
jgi:predicted aspartyl protease